MCIADQNVAMKSADLPTVTGDPNGGGPFRSPDTVLSVFVQKRGFFQYRLRDIAPLLQADLACPTEMDAH